MAKTAADPLALAIVDLLAPVDSYHAGPLGAALRDVRRAERAELVTALVEKLGISLAAAADAVLAIEEPAVEEPTLFDLSN